MALTRDQILSARPKMVPFDVPEWGGTVYLRQFSVAALDRIKAAAGPDLVGSKGDLLGIALSVCDEAGQLIFAEGEADLLAEQSFEVIQSVGKEVLRINNIGDAAGPKG